MKIVVIVLCIIAIALSLFQILGVIDFINTKGKKKDKFENNNPQK
jgi:hypothetical protein